MKTSNIILISLFTLGLIFIVAVQLYLKSVYSEQKSKEFELAPGEFTSLKIESGWTVQIEMRDTSKVLFSNDSIRDLIVLDGNTLILNDIKNDSIKKVELHIYANKIDQITVSGNSHLNYYSDFVDSLYIKLTEKGSLTISKFDKEQNKAEKKVSGSINYVDALLTDRSELIIQSHIGSFNAELRDSSYCNLSGNVQIDRLSKSKSANLRMW